MLFGDADVKETLREGLGELVQSRARGHRRRDRHDPIVRFRNPQQLA